MNPIVLLANKDLKASEKTKQLSEFLLTGALSVQNWMEHYAISKDPEKGTLMEALEYATKTKPELAGPGLFEMVARQLGAKPPRVKWESARVIANLAPLHRDLLYLAIPGLIENSENPGTVVRWSAAFALGTIYQLQTTLNQEIKPAIEAILAREEKNSIRKIYLEALRKGQTN